jgi:hypothetical protein
LQGFQQSARPTGTHLCCQALAELGWLLDGPTQLLAQELRAIGGADESLHVQFCALTLRQSRNGYRTPPAQMPEKSAFGGHSSGCDWIVQRLQQVIDPMANQRLDPQCSLASGWQHDLDREELGNLRL